MNKARLNRNLAKGLVLTLPLLVVALSGAAALAQGPEKNLTSGQAPQYVGADTCKTCHEDLYKSFQESPHWKTTLGKSGAEAHGCESCHGPGGLHVEGGGDVSKIISFKGLSREQASTRCLSCHGEKREQEHYTSSAHASSDVGCLDCHSPHHAKEPQRLLVQAQPQLCYGCHTALKAEFAKPYRHRVNEGLVQCSDCHNAHGTGTVRQARTLPSGDFVCYKCHVDKRGPFVYEHVPVKTEGCAACHTPHASTNPRLLRVSQVNLLCLQCHTSPTVGPSGPVHNQSQKYQACTMCHMGIHGSNFSNVFFK